MKRIIDSHAHLTWESFAEDQQAVIARAFDNGVAQIVQAGVDLASIDEMLKLCDQYEPIYAGVGLHPHDAKLWDTQAENTLRLAAQHKKVVAIGECGLDFHYNHSDRESQLNAFKHQVELALELSLPIIIHARDAWDDIFTILNEFKNDHLKGVFHCFTGSPAELPYIQEIDFYVSFSGIITFKNAQNIQAACPLVSQKRLLVETDCPYLAPNPMRGQRNEPAYIWHTAEKIAQLRSTSLDEIAQITTQNAQRLFGLPQISQN